MLMQEQLQELGAALLNLLYALLNPVVLIPAIIITIAYVKKNKKYKNSAYYQITKLPYKSVKQDLGRYGEYLTYENLRHFETNGARFLFNIYVPKENGETTEIDVLMLCSKGVFVFESKNYSGWIFGDEKQPNWYQTLSIGYGESQKEQFYNPVLQNRTHIEHLKSLLGEQVPMRSIIVFSDRCTLKSVQIRSADVRVINRYDVASVVSEICNQVSSDLLSASEIANIYDILYPFTQVDAVAKAQHIENIHIKNVSQSNCQNEPTDVQIRQPESIQTTVEEEQKTETAMKIQCGTVENKDDGEHPTTSEIESVKQDNEEGQVLKCPKCGGKLVLRIATKGANVGNRFYGCSNYPRCKYIKNLTTEK